MRHAATRRYIKNPHQGLADSVFNETIQPQASAPDSGNTVIPSAAGTTAPPSARARIAQWGGVESIPVPADTTQEQFLDSMVQKMKAFFRDAAVTASRPAHVDPNYWSSPLDLSDSVLVPAAVMAPAVWTTVTSYTVPSGSLARVQGYGVNVQDPAYTYDGSLIWRIQVNGNNVPNLADFAQQRGSLVLPRQTYFVVKEDQTISFQVRRDTLGTGDQVVEVGLFGWLWQPRNDYDNARNARVF